MSNFFLATILMDYCQGFPLIAARNISNTTETISGWTEAPNSRGTFDLLLGCLTSLALCAWTAYHPNIHPDHGIWRTLKRRLLWMVVAVFVPEIVLFCAWEQWWVARKLRDDVNNIVDCPPKTKNSFHERMVCFHLLEKVLEAKGWCLSSSVI
jgi:hypothetical protein